MEITSFDHVALWTSERDALAALLTDCCGMHVIERTDTFTLVGGHAREGKLTLFVADAPRERGVLGRIAIRVPRVDEVRNRLAEAGYRASESDGAVVVDGPDGVQLEVVGVPGTEFPDLEHVALTVPDPETTAASLAELGPARDGDQLRIGDRRIVLRRGDEHEGERPLLNHLAFLVDSATRVEEEARSRGLEIENLVDAPNTLAVFLRGPDRLRLEYVEHKPGFALE